MFTTRPEIQGTFGAVASTHWVATAVGMSVLERGGNAFDAAVAAGFTLQVVEPHQNGPAGDVPILLHEAPSGRTAVICGQGPAPAAATIARFRDLGLDLVPGTGLLAAVVPGAFDAWMRLLRDFGTWRVRDVLAPAIAYARDGYPVSLTLNAYIDAVRDLLAEAWPTSGAVYLPGGRAPARGTLLANPALGDTYARIVTEAEAAGGDRERQIEAARDAFYRGFVTEGIDRFARGTEALDSSGRRHSGLITADDMAAWESRLEAPVTRDYHGYTLAKTGPWGQGPVFLQALALLEGYDIPAMDPNGAEFVHTLVECIKLALADREAFYGDPDFVDVPLDALLSADHAAARRALVGAEASAELRPSRIEGHEGRLPRRVTGESHATAGARALAAAGAGEPNVALLGEKGSDTVNLNICDRHGNMVSAMPSGGWLQSSPVIPELGFCLGTRLQMCWLEEGLASSLEPGKRPRTTLTPGLALRDGVPYMAFGSPGGDGQDQWALQLFLRHVHHGLDLQQGIDAPAFLSSHAPNSFYPRAARPNHLDLESRFGAEAISALQARGHGVEVVGDWMLGRLSAVTKDGAMIRAGANPRNMSGYAAGR